MASPFFPNLEEILQILKGELPESVYADDYADDVDESKRSYSSAELRAMSALLRDVYEGLIDVDRDKFISTVTEAGLVPWEKTLFREAQDGAQPFESRKQNLLSKIRANGGISLPAISDVAAGILTPAGLPFNIITYCGMSDGLETGGWILDESSLDAGTWLGFLDPLRGAGRDVGITPLDCDLDYAAAGLTAQDLEDIQTNAYKYEVLIYGNASAEIVALLDKRLTELEPARSDHKITNNAPLPIAPSPSGSPAFPFGQ